MQITINIKGEQTALLYLLIIAVHSFCIFFHKKICNAFWPVSSVYSYIIIVSAVVRNIFSCSRFRMYSMSYKRFTDIYEPALFFLQALTMRPSQKNFLKSWLNWKPSHLSIAKVTEGQHIGLPSRQYPVSDETAAL